MNWLAIDLTNLFRCHWIQGCVMILVFFWAFLALLGIRNARFPWRILGGLSFVIGSTLWLGLHPGFEFDTGDLGRIVQHSLAGRIPSSFALSGLSALLLVCSLIGLLVAIDWLPLLPFAPMLARDDERRDVARLAGVPAEFVSPKIDRPDEELAFARSAAAAVAPRVRAPAPVAPPRAAPPAPPAAVAPPTPPTPALVPTDVPRIAPSAALAPPAPPASDEVEEAERVEETDAPDADEAHDSDAGERDDSEAEDDDAVTNWARFRPRTRAEIDAQEAAARELQPPQVDAHEEEAAEEATADEARPQPDSASAESREIGDELAVDNGAAPSHNSTALEGETRAVEDDATQERKEDAPVLDRDQDPTEDAPHGALAVAEPLPDAPAAALAETLAPRRKKEEEEPAEEPEKEDDEEEGEEEEGEDDDFDDEDSEEEEEDEEFEEEDDEKEGDKEEEEEEEEEDWDDEEDEEEEEEEEDDDEEWEEDDEEEKEDDEEEEKEEEDDESSSRTDPPPSAEAASEAPASSAVELAPAEETPAEAGRPADEVEFLAGDAAEATVADASDSPAPAPADLAKLLFPDLPEEDAVVMVRAVDLIAGTESVSLSRMQRELGITYYSAARVFERLEKEGFLAPYTGNLARAVRITREEWTELRSDGGAG
jgi:hypothetical protein